MPDRKLDIIIEATDNASKVLDGVNSKVGSLSKGWKKAGAAIGAMGAAVGLATLKVAKSTIQAAGEVEQYRIAFGTLIGDMEAGQKTFENLQEFAIKTPFDLPQVLEGSKRLMAMGTAVDDLIPTFQMLGDVASGVGMEKMPQLILAFGQIQAKGRLMGTELRQLTEAGFNLADAMGITNAELEAMVSQGAVSFDMVKQAFIDSTEEGGRFHDMMLNQSQTTLGQLTNLQDSMFKLRASIGEALLPAMNSLLATVAPLVDKLTQWAAQNPEIVKWLLLLGGVIGVLAAIMLAFLAVLIPLTIAATALGIGILALAGWLLLIPVVIAAVIAAGLWLYTHWQELYAVALSVWAGIQWAVASAVQWIQNKISAMLNFVRNLWNSVWTFIKGLTDTILNAIKSVIQSRMTQSQSVITTILNTIKSTFSSVLSAVQGIVASWTNAIVGFFNRVRSAIQGVIDAIGSLIEKAKGLASAGLGKLGFQHGGIVPGSFNEAVPIIAHGGERVVPKTGVDVNGGGGGGGGIVVNLTIEGDVNSMDMLNRITDAVKASLGRDNELAQYGIGV